MNHWLKLATARRIAAEIQIKYCGQPYGPPEEPIEDKMLDDLWSHPDCTDDMWLNVHWDDFEAVCWVQIGVERDCVPR